MLHERGRPLSPIDGSRAATASCCDAPEPALLRRGLAATQRCAARLERSLRRLRTLFPIDAAHLPALDARQQDDIDAFLKRFEQLVLTLQDQVFVGLALQEGEDPARLSRRDVTELMERLRRDSLGRATSVSSCWIRNRLAHLYPDDRSGRRANLQCGRTRPRPPPARGGAPRAATADPPLRRSPGDAIVRAASPRGGS